MNLFGWLFGEEKPVAATQPEVPTPAPPAPVPAEELPPYQDPNDRRLVLDLISASRLGKVNEIQAFLRRGLNPNNCSATGETPLSGAILKGHLAAVQTLLDGGADPNYVKPNGFTALWSATWEGPDSTSARRLLSAAIPGLPAGSHAWREILVLLLGRGANPNLQNPRKSNHTPLIVAALMQYPGAAAELLKGGADPNLCDDKGASPLAYAASRENSELVRLLLDAGADPNLPANDGWTPLMTAASRGNADLACLLLQHNADPLLRDASGRSAAGDRGGPYDARPTTAILASI